MHVIEARTPDFQTDWPSNRSCTLCPLLSCSCFAFPCKTN